MSNLQLLKDGRVAHLVIDRAHKHNALSQEMWEKMPALVAEAMHDPAIRVLILRAADPGPFSAGADIQEFSVGASDPEWRDRNQAAIRAAMESVARARKPVIALIEGACVGGGCGLAIASDFRFATPDARLGITPAKLGLVYSLEDTKLLVDLVGPSNAKRILFTAELVDAGEALRIGLINEVSASARADALALADTIASVSSHSVQASKAMIARILKGQTRDDAETLAQFADAFQGADFKEGVSAFLAKRKASF